MSERNAVRQVAIGNAGSCLPPAAGLLRRFVGATIDIAIAGAVPILLIALCRAYSPTGGWYVRGPVVIAIFLWPVAYLGGVEAVTGSSLGKAVCGIYVISLDGGGDASDAQHLKRGLLKVAESPVGWAVSVLMLLLCQEHRTLGDVWAGTVAVDDRSFRHWRHESDGATFEKWLESFKSS